MAKKLESMSRADLLIEARLLRDRRRRDAIIEVVQGFFGLARTVVQWAGLVGLAYFGWKTSEALAGKITLADVGIDFSILGAIKLNAALSWALTVSFGWMWRKERRLRKKVIAEEHQKRARLERIIDPDRSSSMLEPHGDNPPGDER